MNKELKYIKHFESLNMSSDVRDIIYDIEKDKVSYLLQTLADSDLYKDDEDVNYLALADDMNKLSFRPLKRRKGVDYSRMYEPNIMPTKVGRLVKKIYNTAKPYFSYNDEQEIYITKLGKFQIIEELPVIFSGLYGDSALGKQKIKITIHSEINTEETKELNNPVVIEDEMKNYIFEYGFEGESRVWFTKEGPSGYRKVFLDLDLDKNRDAVEKLEKEKNYIATIEITCDIDIKDADIEKFVNKFVAYQRENRVSESTVMKEVKGEEIKFYYHKDNYKKQKGTLGNSCMRHEYCQEFLNIYCQNPDKVSLIVLLDEDKVVARAILWSLESRKKLLDRCYSIMDYDQVRYENLAKKNDWYYYKGGQIFYKDSVVDATLYVRLDEHDFESYPYVDTLKIYDRYEGTLSNKLMGDPDDARVLSDTEGEWSDYEEEDY